MESSNKTHFNEKERLLLVQLVLEERIIENKKMNSADLKDKADAWERVAIKYASEGCAPRTVKQLKKCWDNMKQRKRKLNTALRHERLMTGGDPPSPTQHDPVMDFIDANQENVDVEFDCPFDSTAAYQSEFNVQAEIGEDDDYLPIPSTSQSPPQKRAKKMAENNLEDVSDEKQLRLKKLREAILQQRELHAKKMIIAEIEERIALTKLSYEEEKLKQLSDC